MERLIHNDIPELLPSLSINNTKVVLLSYCFSMRFMEKDLVWILKRLFFSSKCSGFSFFCSNLQIWKFDKFELRRRPLFESTKKGRYLLIFVN